MTNHPGRRPPAWLQRAEAAATEYLVDHPPPGQEQAVRDAIVWAYRRVLTTDALPLRPPSRLLTHDDLAEILNGASETLYRPDLLVPRIRAGMTLAELLRWQHYV